MRKVSEIEIIKVTAGSMLVNYFTVELSWFIIYVVDL